MREVLADARGPTGRRKTRWEETEAGAGLPLALALGFREVVAAAPEGRLQPVELPEARASSGSPGFPEVRVPWVGLIAGSPP